MPALMSKQVLQPVEVRRWALGPQQQDDWKPSRDPSPPLSPHSAFWGVMSTPLPRPIYLFMLNFSKAKLEKNGSHLCAVPPGLQIVFTVRGTKYAVLIYYNNNYYYYH